MMILPGPFMVFWSLITSPIFEMFEHLELLVGECARGERPAMGRLWLYRAYLRSGFWRSRDQPLWGLTLAKVGIPAQYRGRGWFRNYQELLFHGMPHDVLVLEGVMNDTLFAALQGQPAYQVFAGDNFVRWKVESLEQFDENRFGRIDYTTFVELGGKVDLPNYCRPVIKFPGYKRALTQEEDWANSNPPTAAKPAISKPTTLGGAIES